MEPLDLRNRVKEVRERLNLRQADVAEAIGVTRQTILAIEKGRFNPSVDTALRIAKALREPVDYLFYLTHPSDPLAPAQEDSEPGEDPPAVFDFFGEE